LETFEDYLKQNNKTIFICSKDHTIADFLLFALINDLVVYNINWTKYSRVSIWYDFCRQL